MTFKPKKQSTGASVASSEESSKPCVYIPIPGDFAGKLGSTISVTLKGKIKAIRLTEAKSCCGSEIDLEIDSIKLPGGSKDIEDILDADKDEE